MIKAKGFSPDLYTNQVNGSRRIKTAAYTAAQSAAVNEKLFAINGLYSTLDSTWTAFNITLYADSLISRIAINGDYLVKVFDAFATGSADGIFSAHNTNALSIDESPTTGQIYYSATNVGNILSADFGSHDCAIIGGYQQEICVSVYNDTGVTQDIDITVFFEEIGERSPAAGLTASTQLEPDTEMSEYG